MQTQNQNIKTNIIPIFPINYNKSNSLIKSNLPKGEYSLKQNFFDPSKSSPPNEFMIKLHMRMKSYLYHIDNNDDNFDME
jgi:hypothetical protein